MHIDGEHLLVVLLQQVHGVRGHDVLCATQKERARVCAARYPPRHHAHVRLVWHEVRARLVQIINIYSTPLVAASFLRSCSFGKYLRHIFHGFSAQMLTK